MRLSKIDDETMNVINKQVDNFVERNLSELIRKSPEEIIKMWLEWQFSRYIIDEQEDAFYVNDLETKSIVACVTKKDPLAYQHAHKIREDLNAGIGGSIELTGHDALDELIKTLHRDPDVPTIQDIIDNLEEDGDDE